MRSNDDLKDQYFATGTEYYAVARFAAIGHILPLAGLLFHYALEMFLKGHLCLTLTEQQRTKLSHRLEDMWMAFKNEIRDPALDRHDGVISAVDVFWNLRYPEDIWQRGMAVRIGFGAPPPVPTVTPRQVPHYEFDVEEIDRLVALIFEKSSRNPKAFKSFVFGEARDYLAKWNKTGVW